MAGGMFGAAGTRLDRVQRFDPDANTWTTLPRLPQPVRAAAGAVRGDDFLVIGGTPVGGGGRQVYAFDGAWRSIRPLPRPLYNHSAVTVGGRVYVLGGYDTEGEELRDRLRAPREAAGVLRRSCRGRCTPSGRSRFAGRFG